MSGSVVVSVRVPRWAKEALEAAGFNVPEVVRAILVSLAEALRGEQARRLADALASFDELVNEEVQFTHEEIVEMVRSAWEEEHQ